MTIAASLVALNLVLGKIAATLSLPVYLDSCGTIIAALLLGWPYAIGVGVGTALLAGLVIHPVYPAYAATQAAIALTAIAAIRLGLLKSWPKAIVAGLLIGFVAAVVSAPVTVMLFGGVTLSGTTAVNALLLAAGQNIWKAVLGGSLLIESIDKTAACLLAWLIVRRLPHLVPDVRPA
jgi:energy-coupling factor transport system substrate-specific component